MIKLGLHAVFLLMTACAAQAVETLDLLYNAGLPLERPGIGVVVPNGDEKLAEDLVLKTKLFICVLARDEQARQSSQAALVQAGHYGTRAAVLNWSGKALPFPKGFCNLVVCAA